MSVFCHIRVKKVSRRLWEFRHERNTMSRSNFWTQFIVSCNMITWYTWLVPAWGSKRAGPKSGKLHGHALAGHPLRAQDAREVADANCDRGPHAGSGHWGRHSDLRAARRTRARSTVAALTAVVRTDPSLAIRGLSRNKGYSVPHQERRVSNRANRDGLLSHSQNRGLTVFWSRRVHDRNKTASRRKRSAKACAH